MINITLNTQVPSVDTTLGILRTHMSMFPTFLDFDKLQQYLSYSLLKAEQIEGPLFDIIGYSKLYEGAPINFMKQWIAKSGTGDAFMSTQTGISLSKDSVDQAFEVPGFPNEVKQVVQSWQSYSGYLKIARTLKGLLQFPVTDLISCDNHRMLVVTPTWSSQNTGRVAMSDPAIQNFNRGIQDLVTVPKGWTIMHTDSGQVEPRITYSWFIPDKQIQTLIQLYDDAYFGVLHYCTMPEEDILTKRLDFIPMEITEDMQANRKKIKTYGNAVMYGSKKNPSNDPIKAAMIQRIGNHPMRKAKISELTAEINSGVRIFKTAFGTPIDISKSPKLESYGGESEADELVKLAINNPMQGTAADLMRVSCSRANSILMNKAKNSAIINYVHDAGTFAIHDSDYDKVIDELSDIVAYNVEGWIPIHADPEIGRHGGLFEDLY